MKPTDEQLKRELASLCPHPADADKRKAALQHALAARSRAAVRHEEKRTRWNHLPWMSAAAACIIVMAALAWIRGFAPTEGNQPLVAKPRGSHTLFQEMELLFPNRLDAIITEGDRVDLKIAEVASVTSDDQRVKVNLWHAGRACTVWTFSGRKICMDFDGEQLCFTPLISGDGSVLILTGDQVILPSDPDARDGYRLRAQTLTAGRAS